MKAFFISLAVIVMLAITIFGFYATSTFQKDTQPQTKQQEEKNTNNNVGATRNLPVTNNKQPTTNPTPSPTPTTNLTTVKAPTCAELMKLTDLSSIISATFAPDSIKVEYKYANSNQCIIKILTPNSNYPSGAYVDFGRVNINPLVNNMFQAQGIINDAGTALQIGQKSGHIIIPISEASTYNQFETRFVPSNNANYFIQVYLWGVNLEGKSGKLPQASQLTLANTQLIAKKIDIAIQ